MALERMSKAWRTVREVVLSPQPDRQLDSAISEQARVQAPVVWLLGKAQSGKTSIVRAITGHPRAEIGPGYKPCTRHSRIFDFPAAAPVIRFLDTRGLGEIDYDPAEALAELEQQAHAVVAVARAMDPQQEALLAALRAVRKRHPDWAVLLVQTCLHEGYPAGTDHPPYDELASAPGLEDLRRSQHRQLQAFEALPGNGPLYTVAVDLTQPQEGYGDPDYGLEALLDALTQAGSQSMEGILRRLGRRGGDAQLRQAHPHILGYAAAAAGSDLLPLVGLVSVPTVQGKLLHSLGRIYGLDWDRRTVREFAASLGLGTVAGIGLSLGARQLAKLVPGYGQSVGAAAAAVTSFAVTYALGRAACYYLGNVRQGRHDAQGVARAYREALQEAFAMVRARKTPLPAPGGENRQ